MLLIKLLFALTIALAFVFVPLFLKAMWPKKTTRSLILKMVCATLFVAAGVLAAVAAENRSSYAKWMIFGLAMGWFGDFFLHVKEKQAYFLTGLMSFLGGHLLYIGAFWLAIKSNFSEAVFFDPFEAAVFVLIFAGAVVYAARKKIHFGPALIPVASYTAILVLMLVKAGSLGIRMVLGARPAAGLICVMLVLGAVQFLVSDALLAIINFGGQKKSYRMKVVNIVTYFAAQNLLASTILFIA